MNINLDCMYCIIKRYDSLFSQYEASKEKKLKFMKKVFEIAGNSGEGDTSPYISTLIMRLLKDELNLGDTYYEIKKMYNKLLLSMEDEILKNIHSSEDQLLMALKYAMAGNFIDFGAMNNVDMGELKKLIKNAPKQEIDGEQYKKFICELRNSKQIAYIADNAGEIVFDKILINIIKEQYPDTKINVIVRGKPTSNDATIADAEEIGLCSIVNVVDNGTDIPGTQLDKISEKSKEIIDCADLIIAKGQGNFETLFGCGKNIYYIFLCKCDLFVRRFKMDRYKGIFINEMNVKDTIA